MSPGSPASPNASATTVCRVISLVCASVPKSVNVVPATKSALSAAWIGASKIDICGKTPISLDGLVQAPVPTLEFPKKKFVVFHLVCASPPYSRSRIKLSIQYSRSLLHFDSIALTLSMICCAGVLLSPTYGLPSPVQPTALADAVCKSV